MLDSVWIELLCPLGLLVTELGGGTPEAVCFHGHRIGVSCDHVSFKGWAPSGILWWDPACMSVGSLGVLLKRMGDGASSRGGGRLFHPPHTEVVPSRGQGVFPQPITVLLCVLLSFRERALGSSFCCWMALVIGNLV